MSAIKLLEHLTKFCAGLHTVDTVDIPQLMTELYKDSDGVPQFINVMEAAQCKSKRAKLVINDEYLHAVALKSLLQSGEYETETREWSKLPEADQIWEDWKTTFCEAYVAKRRSEAVRGQTETFWRFSTVWPSAHRRKNGTRKQPPSNVQSDVGLIGGLPR